MRQAPPGQGQSLAYSSSSSTPDELTAAVAAPGGGPASAGPAAHTTAIHSPSDRAASASAPPAVGASGASAATRNPPSSTPHSRDVSCARGRAGDATSATGFSLASSLQLHPQLRTQSHSKSPEPSSERERTGVVASDSSEGLERRPSNSYGHHRQASIVHGSIQHSRGPSFANSQVTSSPLSPEMISAAGFAPSLNESKLNGGPRENGDYSPSNFVSSAGGVGNILQASPLSLIQDTVRADGLERHHSHRRAVTTGKLRRENSHSKSRSGHTNQEAKTVGEYALHHLFNSFVGQAEEKINKCIMSLGEFEAPVEQVCGPGADPTFDQLIAALGHIAKQKPKPLIDTIMVWRKSKGDAAATAKQGWAQVYATPTSKHAMVTANLSIKPKPPPQISSTIIRRNTEPPQPGLDAADAGSPPPSIPIINRQEDILMTERRATVSVYLVCRVLIEIFNQSSINAITQEMASRLEDIVFGQLKAVDPEQIAASPLRMANWRIYGQLLGIMSENNFSSVSNQYLTELAQYQREEGRMPTTREAETRAELLIYGMRHLRLRVYPDERWARTCDFLQSLARLFSDAHGQRLKQAYCQILETFLLPIAANPACDLSSPKWKEFLEILVPRLSQVLIKPRHWNSAFPLHILLLCVSPRDTFLSQWMPTVNALSPKLKERPTRAAALQAICRLLWTYLYRYADPLSNPLRKTEEVIRIVLPGGRRTYLTTEPTVAEPITQLVRMIGFKHPEMCFRSIIFPLVNSDLFASGKDLKIENMEPEKMVIGIRSFLAIMADIENGGGTPPPFPQEFAITEQSPMSPFAPQASIPEPQYTTQSTPKSQSSPIPFNPSKLNDSTRKYYLRFCEILGKITILCDNTFGGQAALDEKFGGVTPKTPITEHFTFGRRDDHASTPDQKQGFYDLLHVAVQALPRCLSDHIPFNSLINLLCTGTAHVQSNIAASSAESLKSIARQSYAQHVAIGFARFIFNFDARYSTMSDEGMLGPGHIESTLQLYVQLIQIWIEEIRQKTKDATIDLPEKPSTGARGLQLDLSGVLAHVEEIESHGLFFLCSQSRIVRAFAITVLRLVTEFDTALGKNNTRIIRIMEGDSRRVLDLKDESLTVAERSRLQKGRQENTAHNTLIELCSSEVSYDSTLWAKVFPNLIRISFDTCPFAVTLGREIVCARLVHMHKQITHIAEGPPPMQLSSPDHIPTRPIILRNGTSPEVMIEQWKLYLIMACTTLNSAGAQSQSQLANAQHARKASKSGQQSQDKINSARSLFAFVIPLLSAPHDSIRSAIVVALGSINIALYRTLLESLQYAVTTCKEEAKVRIGTHLRTPSTPRRNRRTDLLRTEVTNVYKATSHFLKEPEVSNDDWILNNMVTYTRDLRIFLSDVEVQNDLEFQNLRFHFCGLLEQLFDGIKRSKEPSRWMPFESRKSAFSLMEDWCGYSPNQNQIAVREENMRKLTIARQRENGEVRSTAAMEIEKRNLRTAALSAMASLCGGPIRISTESGATLQFDIRRMLSWIDIILNTESDKLHTIGRRALKNLIVHNKTLPYLLEQCIEMCYLSERPKALESYFEVFSQVVVEESDYPVAFWRILGAVLFTLGNSKREIRMKSARLLRTIEEREQKNSRLQDFDISISDRTTAVYKLAQFETSKRLAQQHADLAFIIFSEFSLHFKNIQPDTQRNMVAAILPWVQAIELQLDPNGGPTSKSYMLLSNLFEITIRSGTVLPNEVQALWQALATGPHAGNVQLVLDFIINLCLERREQNFVDYAKQIVVFLASTPAGSKVIEFFLLQVVPKNMVHERREPLPAPSDLSSLPYVADLGTILPVGNKQVGLSLGQVSMIFLVDLMVAPVSIGFESVIKLIHVALIFWDHYTLTVRDQAREMLVHLIHELVASKLENEVESAQRQSIEDFVECIRQSDPTVVWEYEDNNGKDEKAAGTRVPSSMHHVAHSVAGIFTAVYEGVNDHWSREALNWATSCPVRHLACRSFQVFRCISTSLDSRMLADMLARLSNTIAEEETDYQTFSMEILTTLKVIISSLAPQDLLRYPQLFWTTCACLNTIHEREFMESLAMLEKYLDKIDLSDESVAANLLECKPPKWEGEFCGIQDLVYKGLKSSESLHEALRMLRRLAVLPNNDLIGDGNRLLFAIWANLPELLNEYDTSKPSTNIEIQATLLASIADKQGYSQLSNGLLALSRAQYRTSDEFLAVIVNSISMYFFPGQDVQSLVFLMGLLTNNTSWFRVSLMRILSLVISEIDMRRPDISCHGPDLISPLLRLLHTNLCPQALGVLDHIMTVAGNPMERHHLRMSMASSASSRAIRKEFEGIQSLYGIPEPNGWSIPIPAVQSNLTRNNVHAVFYTCAEEDGLGEQPTTSPDLEFHVDDYGDSYFPAFRADTMKSVDTGNETNMGDLLQKLDSLDDFFEETEVNHSVPSITGASLHSFATNDFPDASTHLYDQHTAPLLRKSLARTASSSSFHNGFADSRLPLTRTDSNSVGTPSIHPSPLSTTSSTSNQPRRGSLHTRSITSPSNYYPQSGNNNGNPGTPEPGYLGRSFLSDDEIEDALSDSEDRLTLHYPSSSTSRAVIIGNSNPEAGSFSLDTMIRSGVRRLTGGNNAGRDRDRQRELLRAQQRAIAQSATSPRVPKVPPEYLTGGANNPTSPHQ
ncbi:cell morphogenesis protein PAG1 [Nannizzia gypsea CBS 118893]|uniref:Cell morphogenesis protein PAG1 n=1 Tax=Arthroderma gypseum (strain ATCC MYA-4604 / CBS 118893) TaxID=535722 RepID=E4UXE0_ARTGP|nr:cell morphogenesis protein PAG1 [Nannizzia gypsea CBS 118893]EFR01888.1 cell morphogenesis protein PAG1 [Nannizzia gypsea CBS 118893]